MTTTPLMPNGLNSWNTSSTIVACARLAASTMDDFTRSTLLRASASQSNSSSSRCRPSACNRSLLPCFSLPENVSAECRSLWSFFLVIASKKWPPARILPPRFGGARRARASGALATRPRRRLGEDLTTMHPGTLTFEQARELAQRPGPPTPPLALSRERLGANFADLHKALPNVQLYYAIKANPHREILRLLRQAGSRFDVSSIEEIRMARRAGGPPDELLYTKPINKPEEL